MLDQLSSHLARIMQAPDMKQRMTADGLVTAGSTRQQFAAHIKLEIAKWAKVIQQSGARVD